MMLEIEMYITWLDDLYYLVLRLGLVKANHSVLARTTFLGTIFNKVVSCRFIQSSVRAVCYPQFITHQLK